jgi:hypothetical protein
VTLLQHILEKGKAHERSQIIRRLAGQVVSMSQNKFASNVIEKCFQHGDVAERDLLTKEILEQTEGNDYLQVCMMNLVCFFLLAFYAFLRKIALFELNHFFTLL